MADELTLIALTAAAGLLLLALTSCVRPAQQFNDPQVHGPGYAPAYPSYEIHQGRVSICQ